MVVVQLIAAPDRCTCNIQFANPKNPHECMSDRSSSFLQFLSSSTQFFNSELSFFFNLAGLFIGPTRIQRNKIPEY
eukprot:4520390-Pyramimonas_sp.AAC.1